MCVCVCFFKCALFVVPDFFVFSFFLFCFVSSFCAGHLYVWEQPRDMALEVVYTDDGRELLPVRWQSQGNLVGIIPNAHDSAVTCIAHDPTQPTTFMSAGTFLFPFPFPFPSPSLFPSSSCSFLRYKLTQFHHLTPPPNPMQNPHTTFLFPLSLQARMVFSLFGTLVLTSKRN